MEPRALSGIEAQAAAHNAARLLAEDARVKLVYLFGSATDAQQKRVRDVDLAVLTNPALPMRELMRWRADLVRSTGAPIDLVALHDAPVTLAHEIAEYGVCLYAESPEIETEFVTRARARHWDFRPFRSAQWRLAGERLKERSVGSQA